MTQMQHHPEHLPTVVATWRSEAPTGDSRSVSHLRVSLQVHGARKRDWHHLTLRLAGEPRLVQAKHWHLPKLPNGCVLEVDTVQLDAAVTRHGAASHLSQPVIVATLETASGRVLTTCSQALPFCPNNQLQKLLRRPDLVANLIDAKDPCVQQLVAQAERTLLTCGVQEALPSACRSRAGRKTVLEVAWQTLLGAGLQLISHDPKGHTAPRPPQHWLPVGQGTVVEAALVLAAVLACLGLDVELVAAGQELLLGLWLVPQPMVRALHADPAQVATWALTTGDLAILQPLPTSNKALPDFTQVGRAAVETLRMACAIKEVLALSLVACRERGLLSHDVQPLLDSTLPPDLPTTRKSLLDNSQDSPSRDKQLLQQWQHELLDLSLRNPLLHFRQGAHGVPLMVPNAHLLVATMMRHKSLTVRPLDESSQDAQTTQAQPLRDHRASVALSQGIVFLDPSLLVTQPSAHLGKIWHKHQQLHEEGDANTLYLALGTIHWKRQQEAVTHLAPFVLVPVRLEQGGVNHHYVLAASDDEPIRINPALLAFFSQEFRIQLQPGEPQTWASLAELDIGHLLTLAAKAVHGRDGFGVTADSHLALLSFSRHLMWLDVQHHAPALHRNTIVQHLITNPHLPIAGPDPMLRAEALDSTMPTNQMVCPLPADSSQLLAVQAALSGQNFVLMGPPGTGKSQTIVNIIAQCLAHQRKVLFVSAKAAALDVVHDRLSQLGLQDLCLSLHQHAGAQSRKRAAQQVQAAYENVWAAGQTAQDESADRRAWKKHKDILQDYVCRLHAPGEWGQSPFDLMGTLAASRSLPRLANIWSEKLGAGHHSDDELLAQAAHLGTCAGDVQDLFKTPLGYLTAEPLTLAWQGQCEAKAHRAMVAARKLQHLWRPLQAMLPAAALTLNSAYNWLSLLRLVLASACHLRRLGSHDWAQSIALLQQRQRLWGCVAELKAKVPQPWPQAYCDRVLATLTDVQALRRQRATWAPLYPCYAATGAPTAGLAQGLLQQFNRAGRRVWPLKVWLRRRVVSRLQSLRQRRAPGLQLYSELLALADFEGAEQRVRGASLPQSLTHVWRGELTHLPNVRAVLALHHRLAGLAVDDALLDPILSHQCGTDAASALSTHQAWRDACGRAEAQDKRCAQAGLDLSAVAPADGQPSIAQLARTHQKFEMLLRQVTSSDVEPLRRALKTRIMDAQLTSEGRSFFCAAEQVVSRSENLLHDIQTYIDMFMGAQTHEGASMPLLSMPLQHLATHSLALQKVLPRLPQWCAWQRACTRAESMGLDGLVTAIRQGILRPQQALPALKQARANSHLQQLLASCPELQHFTAAQHEATVSQFCHLDEQLRLQFATQLLAQHRARLTRIIDRSEPWHVIGQQAREQQHHMSPRRLLDAAGGAVQDLMPCLMMSPLSVARYLDASAPPFDVVIFDEASQLPISEAVGAMGRGTQVIVVGDPKQLPPTQFFAHAAHASNSGAAGGPSHLGRQSVLDVCRAMALPEYSLRWHYRSRHESLIEFANRAYYQGKLITHPSPQRGTSAISHHYVAGGLWSAHNRRTNPQEAQALVAHLVQTLTTSHPGAKAQTVGIIAFNIAQAELIAELMAHEASRDPRIAQATGVDGPVKLFVKALEHVQGDERDIIYLSVAYGPKAPHQPIAARFGPLNGDGGERRLNVAITRARSHMHVFCSFLSGSLALHKCRGQGPQDLRAFLAYAERLSAKQSAPCDASVAPVDEHLLRRVRRALQKMGWQVEGPVGMGSYRVDLAIVHPACPGRYLAGITGDGASYRAASTVRDRDSVRPDVMAQLGWQMIRLWSPDFYHHEGETLLRLHRKLEALLRGA